MPVEGPSFEIVKPQDLVEKIPNAPLSAQTIVVDLAKANVDKTTSFGIEGLQFVVQGGMSLSIHGFNSEDDSDEDEVFGKKGAGGDVELQPALTPGSGVYLKYRAEAEVKASAEYAASFLAIEASGKKSIVLADYHRHAPTENARKAVLADFGNLKAATRPGDIARLSVGDAVALRLSGELKASLEVDWSDVLIAGMGTLTKLLRSQTPLAARFEVGADLKASIAVKDDFVIVFKGESGGKTRVALRKAGTRATGIAGGFGIKASFDDAQGVAAALNAFVDGVIGSSVKWIDAALERTELDSLSEAERQIVDALIERFELGGLEDGLAKLRERWEDLKSKLSDSIEAVANAKLEAGFRYEYQRVATTVALLEVVADASTVAAWHASLIHADFSPVMTALASATPSVELVRYLNQKSLTRKESYGFTLGLGNWKLSGITTKELTVTVQTNWKGWQRVAYRGVRSYDAQVGGVEADWSVDFKADSNEYFAKPGVKDLYLGLHLLYHGKTTKNFDEKRARRVVDEAIIWRVLGEAGEADAVQQIIDFVKTVKGKPVETRLELTFSDEVLRDLIPTVANAKLSDFAPDLARAMNWTGDYPDRDNVDRRESLYGPIWQYVLTHPGVAWTDVSAFTAQHLKAENADPKLAYFEGSQLKLFGSAAWFVHMHPKTPASIGYFIEGMSTLRKATDSGWGHESFKSAYKNVEAVWRNYHPVRAVGAYLTRLALGTPLGLGRFSRTLTVSSPGASEVLVISKSA